MYAHCLFCTRALGRNEALETFPVGRRLAYDAARGRLWVVCAGCRRWNLTPLEERWEAIEQAERLFRGARLRASTSNVGLARVADRTELVRIGRPTSAEFASWRYADVFARRRRRARAAMVGSAAVAAVFAGTMVWGLAASGAGLVTLATWGVGLLGGNDARDEEREQEAQRAADDEYVAHVVVARNPVPITGGALRRATLRSGPDGLALTFPFGRGPRTLTGARAEQAAAVMLAHLNRAGAEPETVTTALDRLVDAGSSEAFVAQLSRPMRWRGGTSDGPREFAFPRASAPTRLALEIALNDDRERRAMEGELRDLEQAWREAEEIAAIADNLLVPDPVQRALARLGGLRGGRRRAGP